VYSYQDFDQNHWCSIIVLLLNLPFFNCFFCCLLIDNQTYYIYFQVIFFCFYFYFILFSVMIFFHLNIISTRLKCIFLQRLFDNSLVLVNIPADCEISRVFFSILNAMRKICDIIIFPSNPVILRIYIVVF
jgi:hypothetical protein